MDIDQIRRWEARLEEAIANDLDLIAPNLTIIRRQYILNDTRKNRIGILDIFAQDEDKRRHLLECKVQRLVARDLGQCLGYWGYWHQRCENLKLPDPIVYCIGPSVDPVYEYGMRALSELPIIRTMIYKFEPGCGPDDERWNIFLVPFDEEYHLLRIPM
jgi:hypothetical protein